MTEETKQKPTIPKDYWKIRRRAVITTFIFCWGIILFLLFSGKADSSLHISVVESIRTILAGTVVTYIGVAIYDDIQDEAVKDTGKDFWIVRRLLVISHSLLSAFCVIYLMLYGDDKSRLQSALIESTLIGALVVLMTYIGGSSIQSKYQKKI